MSGEARRRAGLLVDARQYDLARPEIARALAEDPDDAAAFHVLALLEQRTGNHDESLAALDRAAELGLPPTAHLYTRLNTLYHARRFPKAVATAEELLRHDPQHVLAHVLLAQMLGGEGRADYHRARAHGEHAVSLAPENDHAHYALGQVLASTHGRSGARAALPHLQQAVRLKPDDPANLNALGLVDLTLGRSRRALRSFADALAVDPTLEPTAFNVPLAMLGLVRRAGLVLTVLFLAAAVAGVALAPRLPTSGAGASAGAGAPGHAVAVVAVLAVVGLVAAWLRRAVPASLRPAASRAWRRDPVVAPLMVSSAVTSVLSAVLVVLPVPNGVHVLPLLLLGLVVRVVAVLVSRARTARYGQDRRTERAELWRPPERPPRPDVTRS
ncbi:tetratricopeptide repeat protein [Actinomycetospora soli]|uniref:tetratricopeptide repeat protein n=1 Tax=Actinomycetospora soli TaxID=2893887 RepID=UPI001E37F67B|nr:tetratricopeptide repeat protein [Actinomycetospora soli]MCD2185669.1 tetratricopeptide repeat protein [Actinomycetospora soli]